jgi:tetratricopeptide (TPR) repeat protein
VRCSKLKEASDLIGSMTDKGIYKELAILNIKINLNVEDFENYINSNNLLSRSTDVEVAKILIKYYIFKGEFLAALEIVNIFESDGAENLEIKFIKIEILIKMKSNNDALKLLMSIMIENKTAVVFEKLAYLFYELNMNDKAFSYIKSSIKMNEFKLSSWKLRYKIAVSMGDEGLINESISNINYLNQWID